MGYQPWEDTALDGGVAAEDGSPLDDATHASLDATHASLDAAQDAPLDAAAHDAAVAPLDAPLDAASDATFDAAADASPDATTMDCSMLDGAASSDGGASGLDSGSGMVVMTGAVADTALNSEAPTYNYGAAQGMTLRSDAISQFVGLLRFDLSSLPSGTITTAEVRLTTTTIVFSSGRVDLYELLEEWQEGSLNGGTGAASGLERLPGVPWISPNAGVGSRAATSSAGFSPTTASTVYAVPLPPTLVQRWLDSPADNHGLALVASGHRTGASVQLATRESSSGGAVLVVGY